MRWFVRQAVYGGRVCAFNQHYKSKICNDILKIISKGLNVKGSVYDKIEAYMKYKNEHFEIFKKEYENQFSDYRNEIVEEKEKYINEKLSDIPIHQLKIQLEIIELLWNFDCVSLYPSTMWDQASIYPRIETGYAFTPDMNDEFVENFNN